MVQGICGEKVFRTPLDKKREGVGADMTASQWMCACARVRAWVE